MNIIDEEEFIRPKLDVVFKMLMASDEDILRDVLAAFLEIPKKSIDQIVIMNPNILPTEFDGKQSQLDLKVNVDGKTVDIEIQLCDEGDFPERSLYYWAKAYTDDVKRGEKYKELRKTICINIVDFNLFNCDEPYSSFSLLENKRREQLTDKCSIMFMELPKIDAMIDKNDRRKLWLQFIKSETKEELDMLERTEVPEIKKAIVTLHQMTADERVREEVRMRMKNMLDENTAKENARREGLAEGEAKGRAKERADFIAGMRKAGFSEEAINSVLKGMGII